MRESAEFAGQVQLESGIGRGWAGEIAGAWRREDPRSGRRHGIYPDILSAAHNANASNIANLLTWSASDAAAFVEPDEHCSYDTTPANKHRYDFFFSFSFCFLYLGFCFLYPGKKSSMPD